MFKCLHISVATDDFGAFHSPNFRVTHETLFQSNSQTVRLERDKIVFVPNGIHVSGITVEDGVSFLVVRQSPSIVDTKANQ